MEMSSADIERMRRILRHRLLNIVSGVKSANSMLATQLDDRLTPREREYFPLIQQECDQVTVIVNRMDELFGPVPPPEPTALEAALSAILTQVRHRLPMAEIDVVLEVADAQRTVCAGALQVLLSEAVVNAYDISRKPVRIELGDSAGACSIRVMDAGDAVSAETLEMAFEPFYSGRTRHLGIGLALAARWVAERGGSFSFESGPDGNVAGFVLPYLQQ